MEHHARLALLDHRPAIERRSALLGVWLRSTFVGVAVAGAGVALLVDPQPGASALTALACIAAGVAVATLAWRRTAALLDQVGSPEPTLTSVTASPRRLPGDREPVLP